jgi:8-oxo-dGTP diphosphatase
MDVQWRRAAVYVLCRDGDRRVLLTRFVAVDHPDHGRWTMPGGAMEWGESMEQTAHRELDEETGLTAELGAVRGVFSRWYTEDESARGQAGHVVGVVVEALTVAGELRTQFDEGTTDDARWFTLDEVRTTPHVELVDYVLGILDRPSA